MISRLSIASKQTFTPNLEPRNAGGQQFGTSIPEAGSLGGWQFHRDVGCRLSRRLDWLEFGSPPRYWLQTYRKDTFAMTTLRQVLLIEGRSLLLNRLREEDVIEQVARLLESGLWHICEPVVQLYAVSPAKEPAQAASTLVPRRAPRQSETLPPAREIAENPTLSVNADQAAIGAVLTGAAASGTPFCQECLK
jgi:hypothetical protein